MRLRRAAPHVVLFLALLVVVGASLVFGPLGTVAGVLAICSIVLLVHGLIVVAIDAERTAAEQALRRREALATRNAAIVRAVTRQRQLEAQLRQTQNLESVGQLAGGVAHEFNNLLQVIQGYTALASDPEIDPQERAIALVHVQKAADRAAQLTRQLLAFGRRQPLLMCDTDLAETMSHVLQIVRRLVGEHIEVRLVTSGSVDNVRCDGAQIEQVVLTLCVNARHAMPDGGQLTLTVDHRAVSATEARRRPGLRPGAYVRLRVSDTGSGMSPETKRRAFEPFFTTKAEGAGSGLGLAVAYGVVKQHGGFIDIESAVGTGTTVTILLPVVAPKPCRAKELPDPVCQALGEASAF